MARIIEIIEELDKLYSELKSLSSYTNDTEIRREVSAIRDRINLLEDLEVVV
jgi:hypothetical protein